MTSFLILPSPLGLAKKNASPTHMGLCCLAAPAVVVKSSTPVSLVIEAFPSPGVTASPSSVILHVAGVITVLPMSWSSTPRETPRIVALVGRG